MAIIEGFGLNAAQNPQAQKLNHPGTPFPRTLTSRSPTNIEYCSHPDLAVRHEPRSPSGYPVRHWSVLEIIETDSEWQFSESNAGPSSSTTSRAQARWRKQYFVCSLSKQLS